MTDERTPLFNLEELGEILGSNSEGDPGSHRVNILGVSTDSRTVKNGELFVALKGDNHDGHDFLETAFSRGAAAAIVEKGEALKRGFQDSKYIAVSDTLEALGELARRYRRKMPARIVGVTGSNGKTTVKNLVYQALLSRGPAIKSQGNFNNLIGLPISIFQLRKTHLSAVFELGMSARGEIARLGQIASPDVAVITNVGPVHLEFLKDIEAVADAKLELLDHIENPGVLVINGDDEVLGRKMRSIPQPIIRFGLGEANDVRPQNLGFDENQMPRFEIDGTAFSGSLPGIHNVYNILATAAVARAMGISLETCAEAVNAFRPEGMRSEVLQKGGVTLLVDCYNANPASMRKALETLARMNCAGRRMAVLGDMLELGEAGLEFHREIGRTARALGINMVFGFGPLSRNIVDTFGDGSLHFDTKEGLASKLIETVKTGDIILFKGSRGMVLEEVVNSIENVL